MSWQLCVLVAVNIAMRRDWSWASAEAHQLWNPRMPSYLDEILSVFDNAAGTLAGLEKSDYSPDQLNEVLATVGSQTEVFLKAAALPGGKARRDFVTLIDGLGALGLEPQHGQALHALRKAYNAAKHDPLYTPTIGSTRETLRDGRQALERVGALGIGRTNTQRPIPLRRVFWIFATDHYIGGDTEVSIVAPADNRRGLPLDTIYIGIPEWEAAIAELSTLGELRMGTSNLPAEVVDWYRGDDFLTAGVFEGSYRDLLLVFAKRELRQALLPGLNRHDDYFSILQSAVLATIDIVRGMVAAPDESVLTTEIINLASSDYAVPADSEMLERVAIDLARCVTTTAPDLYPSLSGPSWVPRKSLAGLAAEAFCSHGNSDFVLDKRGIFRLPVD